MSDIKDYGKALFELAKEENGIEGVSRDVNAVISIVKKTPDYLVILNSPTLSKEEKRELIDEAFGTLNENLCNLLKLMCDKRMAHLYAAALQGFLDEYDAYMGILRVDAVTVRPLTQEQSERLTAKLEARTGKKVIINNIIDTGILGGIKLRYDGIQLDGSIKTRLEGLAESLDSVIM